MMNMIRLARKILAIMAFALCGLSVCAQNDANFTQYWTVPNYYNAAAIGTIDFVRLRGGMKMQWVGITNAPKSFLITADSPFKLFGKRIGAGIVMQQESIGLYKNMNLTAQVAYKFKLFKGQFSDGLQVGLADQTFKGSEVILPDDSGDPDSGTTPSPAYRAEESGGGSSSTDEAIPTTDIHGTSFDASLGVFYTHKYFWVGLSATHINEPTIKLGAEQASEQSFEAKVNRAFYFMAGSNIPIKNTLFELQPSVLVRNGNRFTQADITLRVRYNKFLSGGVAYRTSDAVSLMLAAEFKNFFVGYSYDYALSAISQASSGSHELFLGYNLKLNLGDKNKNKHKSIRIM